MRSFCIILFIISKFSYGQVCKCENDSNLNEIISCDTTEFENGSKLYRQFNCDSSWLTFENKMGIKTILYTLDGLVMLTEKLGYVGWTEYKNVFLIQNNLISGCCDPPEYIVYNKNSGKYIKNLGALIYLSDNKNYPYVILFSDTTLNSITLLNVDNSKYFKIKLPKNRINTTLNKTGEMFPEQLFMDGNIDTKNGILQLNYRFQKDEKEDKWYDAKISIHIRKYSN